MSVRSVLLFIETMFVLLDTLITLTHQFQALVYEKMILFVWYVAKLISECDIFNVIESIFLKMYIKINVNTSNPFSWCLKSLCVILWKIIFHNIYNKTVLNIITDYEYRLSMQLMNVCPRKKVRSKYTLFNNNFFAFSSSVQKKKFCICFLFYLLFLIFNIFNILFLIFSSRNVTTK